MKIYTRQFQIYTVYEQLTNSNTKIRKHKNEMNSKVSWASKSINVLYPVIAYSIVTYSYVPYALLNI